jgi:hypothetical protein
MGVTIVGGGLTGILAAFEAHRLGWRDIVLHERFDRLGGVALPRSSDGLELRDGCIYFGAASDPIRAALEAQGCAFDEFDNRFGSVSPRGAVVDDFSGPMIACAQPALTAPKGPSLADRIAAYPQKIATELARYAQWHVGAPLDEVHGEAAHPLGMNRVYPAGSDLEALAKLKRTDPLHDELYAIPRHLWGRQANARASLPRGGFSALFRHCREQLEALGVSVRDTSLVSPRDAVANHKPGDVLVWAASPTLLFKTVGVPAPKLIRKSFASYVFEARWSGPLPFYVHNFTADGAIFRAYVYESGAKTLVTAECVREAEPADVAREAARLLEPFGTLTTGDLLGENVHPRWIYHSVETMDQLVALRAELSRQLGVGFVPGAWEVYSKAEKLAQVNAALAAAARVTA